MEIFPLLKPSLICLDCLSFIHLQFPVLTRFMSIVAGVCVSWDLYRRRNPSESEVKSDG